MAAKQTLFDGVFDLIAAALPDSDFTTTDRRRAQFTYKGRVFGVEIHTHVTAGDREYWATVTPPNVNTTRRRRWDWARRVWVCGRRAEWLDVAGLVADRIRVVTEYCDQRAADEAKQKAVADEIEQAKDVIAPLKEVVKHDDRMRLFETTIWRNGGVSAAIAIQVILPRGQWHFAQMIVDFLKEGCGDPRPEQT